MTSYLSLQKMSIEYAEIKQADQNAWWFILSEGKLVA